MTKTVYLMDASTFIHRSYHAIRHLAVSDGRPTNAVFGFTATLNKLLKEDDPEYLAVVYDAKGPSFRKELYPEYKANRPPMPEDLIAQQEPIRRIVEALGVRGVEVEGLEADDIIAALTRVARQAGYDVVIVSSDKDFYQLLGDGVRMYDPNPKRETSLNAASIDEKFGLTPAGFLEAQGLMGDSTDNIPGIPGVGEKTAAKLIAQFGTIEELYQRLDEVPQAKLRAKLEENRDSAFLSRDLARLKADAELNLKLEDLVRRPAQTDDLLQIYEDLEFTRFAAELAPTAKISYEDYHLVTTTEELEALLPELAASERLSVDLETTSLDPMRAEIVGLSLAPRPHRAFYIPVGHQTLGAVQLEPGPVLDALRPSLEDEKIPKVGQNIKYDYIILARHGVTVFPISDDPMVASYLLDPGAGGHGLDDLCRKWLGHENITYQQVVGSKKAGFETVTPEAARDYACEDADAALILAGLLREKLEQADLNELYDTLELPLVSILAEMEMNGVGLDRDLLETLSQQMGDRLVESEKRIYALAGREFNINSPKQLGAILFEDLQLPQGKKTQKKTGYSTDVEVLTDLARLHELPAEILNYRTLTKLRSTYVDALAGLIHPDTGRVHTSFNQTVTATGRLSSSDPNLQNIPVRTDEGRRIREAFIPGPGGLILSADYSQIELRILAHYSGDPNLQQAFTSGEDVHTRTAAEIFDVFPALVTPEMRREAKAVNFGIVYGQQAFGLARQLGIERKTAQQYIDQYLKRYAGVKTFMEETMKEARKIGYVTTLMGRRRLLPELKSKNYQARSMAERMAINTPIQGSAADLIKKAMIAVHQAVKKQGLKAKMILQVHDELVFDAPENEIETLTSLVREHMEGAAQLDVPLVVDVSHGKNWAEAH